MIDALRTPRYVGDALRLLEAFRCDIDACGDSEQRGTKVICDEAERKKLYRAVEAAGCRAVFEWLGRVARCNGAAALRAELEHIASDVAAECPDALLRRCLSESGEFAAYAVAIHHPDHEIPRSRALEILIERGRDLGRNIMRCAHLLRARCRRTM